MGCQQSTNEYYYLSDYHYIDPSLDEQISPETPRHYIHLYSHEPKKQQVSGHNTSLTTDHTDMTFRPPDDKEIKELAKVYYRAIIKIQCLFRKLKARKLANSLNKKQSLYFQRSEFYETLGQKMAYKHLYKTGSIYMGEWKGGFRHGEGCHVWTDKGSYTGTWNYGKAEGKGKFFYPNGDLYQGEWNNDLQHGFGVFQSEKENYQGWWRFDLKHGLGVQVNQDNQYLGQLKEWKEGEIHGIGECAWDDGSIYQGQWENGIKNGYGSLILNDCREYEGQFKDNKFHGYGVLKQADGVEYRGYWIEGSLDQSNNSPAPEDYQRQFDEIQLKMDQIKEKKDQLLKKILKI